jgi:hypothetical protein
LAATGLMATGVLLAGDGVGVWLAAGAGMRLVAGAGGGVAGGGVQLAAGDGRVARQDCGRPRARVRAAVAKG